MSICKLYTVVQCHSNLIRGKKSPFFMQMKSPLSAQNWSLADAWQLQVGNKGEHMGSRLQGWKLQVLQGTLKPEQMLCTVEGP